MLNFNITIVCRNNALKYPIVKPYLPSIDDYQQSISGIFTRNYLTNNGPLLQQLEQRLTDYLGVEHLLLVANGTLALQIAYAALNVKGKVLTTPFSFAATASSLCWQNIEPIFIDVNKQSFNFDVNNASTEQAKSASAILPVHVFGNPCDIEAIDTLAKNHNLTVIYDAAHAFATQIDGESVLKNGDAATLSLHATKLFHCVEGGAIIFKDKSAYEKAKKLINFGFDENNIPEYVGINAKMSEFHAAMGLAVLDDIEKIMTQRKLLVNQYKKNLSDVSQISFQQWHCNSECIGAYMPILLENEKQVLHMINLLAEQGVQTRRYFYPSLSQISIYCGDDNTPNSNEISARVLCLPLYSDLMLNDVDEICRCIKAVLA